MRGELRNARDAAVALHDPAVSRRSRNFEAAFAAAMSEAIERLERIIADTERVRRRTRSGVQDLPMAR